MKQTVEWVCIIWSADYSLFTELSSGDLVLRLGTSPWNSIFNHAWHLIIAYMFVSGMRTKRLPWIVGRCCESAVAMKISPGACSTRTISTTCSAMWKSLPSTLPPTLSPLSKSVPLSCLLSSHAPLTWLLCSLFQDLLTRHKILCAEFLDANYDRVFTAHYQRLLNSDNYVTRRQALKVLHLLNQDISWMTLHFYHVQLWSALVMTLYVIHEMSLTVIQFNESLEIQWNLVVIKSKCPLTFVVALSFCYKGVYCSGN